MSEYPAQPVPSASPTPGAPAVNPGRTLGIVGLVLGIVGFFVAFLAPIAGLIVSILGLNKSKKAGHKNGLAVAGIIVSIVALIANIIAVVVLVTIAASFGGSALEIFEQCQSDPTGFVEFQGQEISCADVLEGATN
ncbi:MAG: hypothetical protein RI885_1635 [Actinomycetota bacterium]